MKKSFVINIIFVFTFFSLSISFGQEAEKRKYYYDVFIEIGKCEASLAKKRDKEKNKTIYNLGINIKKKYGNFYIGSGLHLQNRGYYDDTLVSYHYDNWGTYHYKSEYYSKYSYTCIIIPVILQYNFFQKKTALTIELTLQTKLEFISRRIEYRFKQDYFSKHKNSNGELGSIAQFQLGTSLIYSYYVNDKNAIGLKASYTDFLIISPTLYEYSYKAICLGINYSF